jgi:hypothetical protein
MSNSTIDDPSRQEQFRNGVFVKEVHLEGVNKEIVKVEFQGNWSLGQLNGLADKLSGAEIVIVDSSKETGKDVTGATELLDQAWTILSGLRGVDLVFFGQKGAAKSFLQGIQPFAPRITRGSFKVIEGDDYSSVDQHIQTRFSNNIQEP